MTLGVKPRRLLPLPLPESSGSLITSMARARLGRRRMKPRSSSAVIRRWMPDFERRSSASFISSKEGGTPDSFSRSLMNRSSSYCLRVSISSNPQVAIVVSIGRLACSIRAPQIALQASISETNHERTLYVPYVFRNHLISRQRNRAFVGSGARTGSGRQPQDVASRAGGGCRRKRRDGSQVPVPQRDFPTASES